MPAQITHWFFYQDTKQVLEEKLGINQSNSFDSISFLGAQAGDIFYHNQRTKPSGVSFGSMLHRKKGAQFIVEMVDNARDMGMDLSSDSFLFWYILAFATHGILDRETHPFIVYFSTPTPLTHDARLNYLKMHPFFERVLDRIVFDQRHDYPLDQWNMNKLVTPDFIPPSLLELMAKTFTDVYTPAKKISNPELRIRNAFWDTIGFLHYSDPSEKENALWAAQKDLDDQGSNMRRLALFHPRGIFDPGVFTNEQGSQWLHPVTGQPQYSSWGDLWEKALDISREMAFSLYEYLQSGQGRDRLIHLLGNTTWNVGDVHGAMKGPIYSDPMPLLELFEKQYSILG